MSRRAPGPAAGIQLFPFLAVLICAMGALVVLLFVLARQAAQHAAVSAQPDPREAQLRIAIESAQWLNEQLQATRGNNEAKLAEARAELAHIEEHSRQLSAQLKQLRQAETDLESKAVSGTTGADERQGVLADMKLQIARAEDELAKSKADAATRPVNYSIVPYEGAHGTSRRPIYIECVGEKIILQPEGLVLTEADFEGPLGLGNPLAATLRAECDYITSKLKSDKVQEPYPFILVRPNGIPAYYACRAALTSWVSDFGYELIGQDWPLAFPEADLKLKSAATEALSLARDMQQEIIASAPRSIGKRSKAIYRARPGGGGLMVVRKGEVGDGAPTGGSFSRRLGISKNPDDPDEFAGMSGGRGDAADAGDELDPAALPSSSESDEGIGPMKKQGRPTGRNPYTGIGGGQGNPNGGERQFASSQPEGAPFGVGTGRSGNGGQRGEAALDYSRRGGSPNGNAPNRTGAGKPGAGSPGTGAVGNGQVARGSTSKNQGLGKPGDTGAATDSKPGLWQEGMPPTNRGNDQASGGGSSGASSAAGAGSNSGSASAADSASSSSSAMPSLNVGAPQSRQAPSGPRPRSLSRSRGQNWGLPDSGSATFGISRQIHVICLVDRLVVMPDSSVSKGAEIVIGDRTGDAMDELVSSVWDQMKGWGLAGNGLYWKPTLSVEIGPGGEERFEDLKALLVDSGLEVAERRKSTPAASPAVKPTSKRRR